MNLLATENRPETCSTLGLDCGACMRSAASSVASICGAMDPQGLRQMFFELYPSPGCRPMAQAFELAYRDATTPAAGPILATAAAAGAPIQSAQHCAVTNRAQDAILPYKSPLQ
jgi:hypothetical protein